MVSRGTWGVAEAPGGDGLVFSAALWPKPHIFVCWPVTIGDGSRPSTRPHPKIMVFVFEYRVSGNLRDTGYRFISSRHLVPSKPGQKSLKSSSRSTITSQTVVTTSKYCYGTSHPIGLQQRGGGVGVNPLPGGSTPSLPLFYAPTREGGVSRTPHSQSGLLYRGHTRVRLQVTTTP